MYSMQLVSDKWYSLYRWLSLAAALSAIFFAIISWSMPGMMLLADGVSINYFVTSLAAWQALFALFIYKKVERVAGQWGAMMSLAMVQAVVILGFVETTGRMESPYLLWWAFAAMMSGMFGVMGAGGTALITMVYFLAATTKMSGETEYTPLKFVFLAGFLGISYVSYHFWKRFFVDADSERVAVLTGQLKATQKQSELLVQSLTDGVIVVDDSGVITLINPAGAKMTGWAVDEATGSDSRLVIKVRDENGKDLEPEQNPILTQTASAEGSTTTLQLVNRDNSTRIISMVLSKLINPKTQESMGSIIVIRDVSVTHQSEKQRAEFISTASHEMRTPVAAIEGYLQLAMNDKVSKIDPKARGFLEKALDSTHHLGKLFQDLLTSAKAEDGRLVSHPVPVEMGAYIEQLAESFKFSAEKKGLLTDFIFGQDNHNPGSQAGEHVIRPLYYVLADPDRLREVITNLFDNAVKYTPSGKISVGLTGNNDVVQVFIRDTGPGIPADDIPHLFQKFYRVDNSSTRTIGGTGLGLFICAKIVSMYNGRIWAESELKKGSTFYINLPRLTSQRAEELRQKEAQSTAAAPISSLTTPV